MPRLNYGVLALAAAITLAITSNAAAQDPLKLSTHQGIALALENNHLLKAARNTVEQARARSERTGKWSRPELKLSYANDTLFNNEGESTLGLSLIQRLPITSRLSQLRQISLMEIELAEVEIRNQERLLAEEVALISIELAHLDAQRAHRTELIELNERLAAFVDSRVEVAEASIIEANQVRIEHRILEQDLIKLNRASHAKFAELNLFLGLDAHTPVEIQLDFEIPIAPPHILPYPIEELVKHPAYQLKSKLAQIAGQSSRLAQINRWDDIAIELFLKDERMIDAPNGIDSDKSLGLGVSIPLPNRKRYQAAYRESHSRWQQAEDTLEATGIAIDANALHLEEEIIDIYRQAQHYRTQITPLVNSNVQDMNTAYRSGQVSLTELFRAQEQQLTLKNEYLETIRDYLQAHAEWSSATGININ